MRLLYQDLVMDQGLAARVSEKLTQPITAMGSNVSSTVRCVCRCAREFFLRYVPSIREVPVYQGISWKPTWSSVPNSGRIPGLKDSFSPLEREWVAFIHMDEELFVHLTTVGALWYSRVFLWVIRRAYWFRRRGLVKKVYCTRPLPNIGKEDQYPC